jgi:hypothetical protein
LTVCEAPGAAEAIVPELGSPFSGLRHARVG